MIEDILNGIIRISTACQGDAPTMIALPAAQYDRLLWEVREHLVRGPAENNIVHGNGGLRIANVKILRD